MIDRNGLRFNEGEFRAGKALVLAILRFMDRVEALFANRMRTR